MAVADALSFLRDAADDGRLAALADRHGLALVTGFGSAVRDPDGAHDLDVAVVTTGSPDRLASSPTWRT